ncbi:hypothetical protein FHS27_003506 [Rhodopirellula rubra]|uniref:Uncharacterized protein n=1 Tax=Aporhodopirellula rubra TaxID=980271 RepID=A0A7W5H778_9BACT|nr:hypothetical protein [Aporhodopirellula rubra]MBB3207681.1 hypothetical protein [Aporhodopirellula rubra]
MAVPFSVRCVSCHCRLKVTDEALVGTIVACPRCGSMVQIAEPETPPADAPPPAANTPSPPNPTAPNPASKSPTSQTPTPGTPSPSSPGAQSPTPQRSSPETPTRRVPANPPPASQPPMVVGNENVDSEEMTQSDVFGDASNLGHVPPDHDTLQEAFASPHDAPPVESGFAGHRESSAKTPHASDADDTDWESAGNWSSEPSQRRKKQLLIGVAALGSLLVLGILAAWMFGDSSTPEPVAMQPTATTDEDANIDDPQRTTEDGETEPSTVATNPNDSVANDNTLPIDNALSDRGNPNAQLDESPNADNTDPTTTEDPPTSMQPNLGGPIPNDLIPADILGGNGPVVPPPADQNKNADADNVDSNDPLMEMPAGLEVFTQLLDLPGAAPDAPPTTPQDAPAEELMIESAADAMLDPMLLATPPPEVNIDNALKFRVAIQTEGYPLSDFILVCSELTQVPIQIDWVTLDLADISVAQLVRDDKPGWKPIGDLMNAVAQHLGLTFEKEPTRLFLTISEAAMKQHLSDAISVDDFGDEKDSAQKWIDQFVESTEWEERERIGLRALVTDCLRDARGMPTKLSANARSHWSARAECLDQPIPSGPVVRRNDEPDVFSDHWPLLAGGESGPQLDTAIALAGLLRHTARVNQAACLVNWDDARQRRLSPGQLVLPYANQPAGAMLAKSLAPMGLQTRVADEKHWWVGTEATYDRMPLLIIGDELGPRRDEIIARINEAAVRADTLILVKHDPVSDRYLGLVPRFLYRQLPAILKPFAN